MSYAKLDAAGRAWESRTLNSHLRDWDVSEARDRAIEARTAELLERSDAEGYHPLGDRVALLFDEKFTAGDVLARLKPCLDAARNALGLSLVGVELSAMLRALAEKEAAEQAAIDVDREWNEASGSQIDAYDDRMNDR